MKSLVFLLMIATMTFGQVYNITHFQIGIGIDAMDFTANETCSDLENDFIQKIMERYTVALARIYFRMECIELENQTQPIDASQFHPLAFIDYNLYMASKYIMTDSIMDLQVNTLLEFPAYEMYSEHPNSIIAETGDVLGTATVSALNVTSNTHTYAPTPSFVPTMPSPSLENTISLPSTTNLTTNVSFTNRPTPTSTLQPSAPLPTTIAPTLRSVSMTNCSSQRICALLNFEKFPNGSIVPGGTYVATEWYRAFGLNISVIPYGINWYAPFRAGTNLRQPRIFNSSNPGIEPDGDPDLGSPNEQCTRPGPGKGLGGSPGTKGANCFTHGNILIIQESNKATPDDAYYGGTFDFSFKEPIYFEHLGLMDISQGSGSIKATLQNGTFKTFRYENLGENSYQTINIMTSKVKRLQVRLPESGAITHLKFCNASCDGSLLRRSLSEVSETATNSKEVTSNDNLEPKETSQSPFDRHLQTQAFRWGGTNSMTCRGCSGDSTDARRLSTSALDTFLNSSLFLLPAFESVISVGLTVDLRWEYHTWLTNQKESVGCLGDGKNATVVFEMLASKLL
jgi:hypothetical protein